LHPAGNHPSQNRMSLQSSLLGRERLSEADEDDSAHAYQPLVLEEVSFILPEGSSLREKGPVTDPPEVGRFSQDPTEYGEVEEEPVMEWFDFSSAASTWEMVSSWMQAVVNLEITMLGGGILLLPYVFKSLGLLVGPVALLIVAIMAYYTVHLLMECSKLTGLHTYVGVGKAAFKQYGVALVNFVEFLNTYGVLTTYLIIVEEQVHVMLPLLPKWWQENWVLASNQGLLIILVVGVVLPLSLVPKISYLRFSSFLSLMLTGFAAIVVIFRSGESLYQQGLSNVIEGVHLFGYTAPSGSSSGGGAPENCQLYLITSDLPGALGALPIMFLAFTCHINVFHIYREVRPRHIVVLDSIAALDFVFTFIYYVIVGTFGYALFCQNTPGDVLTGFASNDMAADAARIGVMLAYCMVYPMLCFPCRHSLHEIVFPSQHLFSWKHHIGETLLIVFGSLILAILIPAIATVYALVGAVTASLLVFLMPGMFYLKLERGSFFRGADWLWQQVNLSAWSTYPGNYKRIPAIGMLSVATVLAIICSIVTFIQLVLSFHYNAGSVFIHYAKQDFYA
jgi:amino acid permease